ncbi:MAG: hypothetical protein M3N41_05525 [Acidobacteriota bacterium]|nr:hypothetical protein [Acidobacteriota bacterium]
MIALVASLAALCVIGVCVLAANHAFGLCLDLQVKPIEVANFAIAVFIAFFLQHHLARRATDSRAEKDILIDQFRDAIDLLRSSRDAFFAAYEAGRIGAINKKAILGNIRKLSNALDTSEVAISLSSCKKLVEECKPIRTSYLNYKIAVTGGGFPARAYTPTSLSDQEQAYRALYHGLQALIFRINSHH